MRYVCTAVALSSVAAAAALDRVFIVVGELVTGHASVEPRRDAVFTENRPTPTRCVADGGYPAPDMTLRLAGRDLTDAFAFSQRLQFAGDGADRDAAGPLRALRYVTERRHDALRLTLDDDGKTIDCVATVAGLAANRTSAHVVVHCELLSHLKLIHTVTHARHDKTVLSVSRPLRRCELDSRQLKTVADRKFVV